MKIEGFYTALVTPFKENGTEIDADMVESLLDRQANAGIQGVILGGSTGEGQTLDWTEIQNLISIGKNFKNRIQIWGACSFSGTAQTAERYQQISQLDVDGVLISSPAYNKPPQRGLIRHFQEIAKAGTAPIMVYNIPGRTAVDIKPDTLAEISKIPQVVAIKESSGNLSQIQEVSTKLPSGKILLCGDDPLSLDVWKMGAQGTVSVMSNILPSACSQLWKIWKSEKIQEAAALQNKFSKFLELLFVESNPIPAKYFLSLLMKHPMKPRLPLVDLDPRFHEALRSELKAMAAAGFCEDL